MYPRLFAGIKRQRGAGKPQKVGAKTQGEEAEEAAELGWLVGSLRRTARAWGFSHDENPLAKPGCPISIGAAGRLEKNISYTYTHHALRSTCARGRLSRVPDEDRTKRNRKRVSGESSKVLSAPGPKGPLERLIV